MRDPGSIYFDKATMLQKWIKADAEMQVRQREEREARELKERQQKEAMIRELRKQMSELKLLEKLRPPRHSIKDSAESYEDQMNLAKKVALMGGDAGLLLLLPSSLRPYKNYIYAVLALFLFLLFRYVFRRQLIVAGRIQSHAVQRFMSNYDDDTVKKV